MNLKNISAKWKWLAGAIVVVLAILLFGKIHNNGGSLVAPKNVSFVKQAHGSGTHIWYMSTGQAKDSSVYYIVVLKNGKARTYRTYDDDATLGKISKMNNRQVLSYAKKQDKKYFDSSAKEVSLAANNEHDGFNADFESALSMPSYYLLMKDDKVVGAAIATGKKDSQDAPYVVTFNTDGKMTSSAKGTTLLPDGVTMKNETLPSSTDKQSTNQALLNGMYKGLKEHVGRARYVAPEPLKVKATSRTDDSGNNIVEQKATIQYTSSVDGDQVQDNFLDMAEQDPSIMKRLCHWATLAQKAKDDPDDAKLNDEAEEAQRNGLGKMFSPKFCSNLTKDVFTSDEQEEYTLNLEEPTDFDIYDSHFIGYYRGAKNGYLVTKAQTKKQTAVFAK